MIINQSHIISDLLSLGSRPVISLLNSMVAGLVNPGPIGIDCICKTARFTSVLVSKHFFYFPLH